MEVELQVYFGGRGRVVAKQAGLVSSPNNH